MADEDTDIHTNFDVAFSGVSDGLTQQTTVEEVILGESLLTPGLQTSVRVHSSIHELPVKNLDEYKDTIMSIEIDKPILQRFGLSRTMSVAQTTYRLDNRKFINNKYWFWSKN